MVNHSDGIQPALRRYGLEWRAEETIKMVPDHSGAAFPPAKAWGE